MTAPDWQAFWQAERAARRRRWAAHYWHAQYGAAFGRTPSPMEGQRRWERQRREREARRRQRRG